MIFASSGGARSSSAVIALTVPAVPTGMNTGVSISPRGVWRMPARAFPSVASSSNDQPGVGSLLITMHYHRVAIAEEAIARGDRVAVRGEHALGAGKRAHQHQQRRFGEMKVRDQMTHEERVIGVWVNEEVGRAGASNAARCFECA